MWISYVEALNCGKLGGEPSQVGRVRWESGDVFGQGPEMDGFCNRNLWESYKLPFWRNPSTHQSIWTNNPLEVLSLAWKGQNHWTENSTSLHFWYLGLHFSTLQHLQPARHFGKYGYLVRGGPPNTHMMGTQERWNNKQYPHCLLFVIVQDWKRPESSSVLGMILIKMESKQ